MIVDKTRGSVGHLKRGWRRWFWRARGQGLWLATRHQVACFRRELVRG